MKRIILKPGVKFEIANYTPRKNEFEKGLKYRLFVDDIPTAETFSTLKQAKEWIDKNWIIYT